MASGEKSALFGVLYAEAEAELAGHTHGGSFVSRVMKLLDVLQELELTALQRQKLSKAGIAAEHWNIHDQHLTESETVAHFVDWLRNCTATEQLRAAHAFAVLSIPGSVTRLATDEKGAGAVDPHLRLRRVS